MPWCPNCKTEYNPGVKICSDCGCELTEEDVEKRPLTFGSEDEMEELAKFLKYSHIEGVQVVPDEKEAVYELLVPEQEAERAGKLAFVFRQQKQEEAETQEEEGSTVAPAPLYENSAAKAEDNKSSAYTLLVVGIVGMIAIILGIAGVLPVHLSGTSKYMTYGIMSVLFLLFIVMGVISMKSYRFFAKKAESENSLRDTMEKWCLETLQAEELDAALFGQDEQVSEEEKYFRRTRLVKEKITGKFMNLDEAFLEHFIDEIYGDIFEEE